ncbi:hypothetical protein WN943_015342 [Citrus x changshan-huyou]
MLLLLLLMNDKVALGQDGDPVGSTQGGGGREMVPALFIFGDSLIDNGNNNNLPSFAKANYYPYGIDFNGAPTGRFSNGYTMVDEIEAVNIMFGRKAFYGDQSVVYPMKFQQLASL